MLQNHKGNKKTNHIKRVSHFFSRIKEFIFMNENISFHEENYFLHEHNSHREACFSISTRVRDKKRLEKVGNLVKNSYLYR